MLPSDLSVRAFPTLAQIKDGTSFYGWRVPERKHLHSNVPKNTHWAEIQNGHFVYEREKEREKEYE